MALSVAPYVTGLGFYNDDWFFLGEFVSSTDQSVAGLFASQWNHPAPSLRRRPTQVAYQTLLYLLFGDQPLGYHLMNAGVLVLLALMVYVVLRELWLARGASLAIATIFALSPNYSIIRFWSAAAIYPLTLAACLLGSFIALRAVRTSGRRSLALKTLALSLVLLAALGHEIALPFLLCLPLGFAIHARRLSLAVPYGFLASHLVLVVGAIAYKMMFPQGIEAPTSAHALTLLALSALVPNLGTFGLGLPYAVWWAVQDLGWETFGIAVVIGALILISVWRAVEDSELPVAGAVWVRLLGAGFLLLAAGYVVFLGAPGRVMLSSSSYGNRVAIVGSLGVAFMFVAGIGWVASRRPGRARSRGVFAALVGIVGTGGFFINSALAKDHVAAWAEQQAILGALRSSLPVLNPGSTVVLVGSCPYVRSAIVFARYDLQGALWFLYRDTTLIGDVGTQIQIGSAGLVLHTADYRATYPYDSNLLLFDYQGDVVVPLPVRQRALEYFGRDEVAWPPDCPQGAMDLGVPIFPTDKLLRRWMYPVFP